MPGESPVTTASPLAYDIGAATHVGHVREVNEDALLAPPGSGPAAGVGAGDLLLAVADGMGGHQAGEVASGLAVQALEGALPVSDAGAAGPSATPAERLQRAVARANRLVWEAASRDPANHGMGTTLVCALLHANGEATLANVGDSRAYLVANGRAHQVTVDNSWVVDQVRSGRMTQREADNSPYRHVLSRSLGVMPSVDVDLYPDVRLRPGDWLVLCSDGVSGYLRPSDLSRLAVVTSSAQEFADRLVQLALDRGGADNATVVVARHRAGSSTGG